MATATVERIDSKLLAVLDRGSQSIYAADIATLRTDRYERPNNLSVQPGDEVEYRDIPESEGRGVEIEFDGRWWIARADIYLVHDARMPAWQAAEEVGFDEDALLP